MTDHPDNREQATDTLEKADREMRINAEEAETDDANPPRTTTGWFTAPKFGSASSGGGEIEPGPERD